MNISKITLVFPPFSESAFHGPHLAIPILRGVIKQYGIKSEAIDLNIKTIRLLIEDSRLERFYTLLDTSNLDYQLLMRTKASIDVLRKRGLNIFLNASSTPLKHLLKTIRNVLFPAPKDLSECLTNTFIRPKIAEEIYDEYIDNILETSPTVICFSVAFSEQLTETIELARRIKEKNGGILIWLGGSQINLLDDSQLELLSKNNLFDRISVGNGEQTIGNLIQSYNAHHIPCDSKIVRSGSMCKEEINSIPEPIFDNDLSEYLYPISLPVLVTKGCYWGKCTFCDYPRLSDLGGKRYIARDVKLVLDEIIRLRDQYSYDQVNLISDAVPPAWYKSLAEQAIKNNVNLKTWSYMMHHKGLNLDFFNLLKEAGVKTINFGTESMVDRILGVMKKQASSVEILQNVRDAKSSGITLVCNVIPDYPTTTRQESLENIKLFKQMLSDIGSLNPQMFDLTAGTPIEKNPSLYGIEIEKNVYLKTNHGYHSVLFNRKNDLTKTDRSILNKIFTQMKWEVIIRRRKESVGNIYNHTKLTLDGSTVILNDGTIWLMSLGSQWKLANWERTILDGIFNQRSHSIIVHELKDLFMSSQKIEHYFPIWLDSLIDSGLVITANN